MQYVKPTSIDAAFHFSVEEYLLNRVNEPVFMTWQTDKCAMLGAYQVAAAEIDFKYAKANSIKVVRRRSGGGTIFTDPGTLLYTLILPSVEDKPMKEIVRENVALPLCRALASLGIPAQMEGRNDIILEGKKIAGLAQYVQQGKLCMHGSLLYNTNLEMLADLLTVDAEKISSKAIRSVRSRVTNISEHINDPLPITDFWALLEEKLKEELSLKEFSLTDSDFKEIEKIYNKRFGNQEWTFGRNPKFSLHCNKRFPGGKVELFFDVDKGAIADCFISGDFLGTVPIKDLEELFIGNSFQYEDIEKTLNNIDLLPFLGGITKEELLSCIFE